MSHYKISDLEKLSNIKAHTIRIWEQRYGILKPLRTHTNIRYYSDEHLKKILNIANLINAGIKISAISKLTDEEIKKKIDAINLISNNDIKDDVFINQLITSGLNYNEEEFNRHFGEIKKEYNHIDTYNKIIYPLLHKIGFLWRSNNLNPAQEHFLSNLIKQKLYADIDEIKTAKNSKEKWLLFMPQNDYHDLGLLVANQILKYNNINTCYLGANVPIENVFEVANKVNPTHLLFFIVANHNEKEINNLLHQLNEDLKKQQILICCSKDVAKNLSSYANQKKISSYSDFLALILESN